MFAVGDFDLALSKSERKVVRGLKSPGAVQSFLDGVPYSTESIYRCPLRVLRERVAHCFDGALFAAAMLRRLGHAPLIVDLLPNARDDDHLLALFKRDGHWGAVAKSNFVGLRYREPVFRTLRELVMSYFEPYYNVAGEKTLRGYAGPLNLKTFDRHGWMSRDEPLEAIATRLDQIRRVSVVTRAMVARLLPVDKRSYDAGMLGVDEAGLYRPAGGGGR